MNVVLNVDALLSPPLTGVGHYVRNLLSGLLEPDSGVAVTCVGRGAIVPPPTPADGGGPARPLPLAKRVLMRVPGLVPLRTAVRTARMEREVAAIGCDVYHEPHHIVHPPRGARVVVTMHDLSVLHFPQFHPADRVRAVAGRLGASARRADLVITGSEHTKRDVVATLGIDAAKVRAIHHGVGGEFRPMSATETRAVLEAYGLAHGGYVLALGTREPRKNLDRLLDAFAALPGAVRGGRTLVLVGPAGWRADAIEARIAGMQASGLARLLGYVPDGHRASLYAGAAGFAYPSLYEGFGLPALEAAASGTPVLTSVGSPMAEVLGDSATLVDPLSVDAVAAGLERMLEAPEVAAAARAGGPGWGARFTWGAAVARTVDVYRELA